MPGAAPKRKGSRFELDVARYLAANGHEHVERAYGAGRSDDRGDLDGLPGWVIECKAHRSIDLAGWVDEAEAERVNARQPFAAVVAKRRNRPTGDAYVIVRLSQFAELVRDAS